MRKFANLPISFWACGALTAGLLGVSAPGLAQPVTVEEVTVTARYGPTGELRSLSRVVSYSDLDLTTDAGRTALTQRIRATAHDLCLELGEQPTQSTPPVRTSCEQGAVNSAMDQMRTAVAQAQPKNLEAAATPPPPVAEAAPPPEPPAAPAAGQPASVTVRTVTNGPVPDTPENRRKYGGPDSRAGQRTAAAGN